MHSLVTSLTYRESYIRRRLAVIEVNRTVCGLDPSIRIVLNGGAMAVACPRREEEPVWE